MRALSGVWGVTRLSVPLLPKRLSLHYGKNQLRNSHGMRNEVVRIPWELQAWLFLGAMPLPFLSHQQSLRCLMLLTNCVQAIEERGWLQAVGVVRIGVGQADGAIPGDDEGAGYGELPRLVTVEGG